MQSSPTALTRLLLSAAAIAGAASPATAAAGSTETLLRPAQVWTAGEPLHAGWVVLTAGNRIVAVGPAQQVAAPADATVIELPGATLLPGLIDAHSHLFLHPYNETRWDDQVLKEPVPYRTLRAGRQARATLLAGFTTLRDLGTEGAEYADLSVKRAIEEGMIAGPRLYVATRAIVATGSYGPAPRSLRPDVCCTPQGAQEASGVAEVIHAVRAQGVRDDLVQGAGRHDTIHAVDAAQVEVHLDERIPPSDPPQAQLPRARQHRVDLSQRLFNRRGVHLPPVPVRVGRRWSPG